MNLPLVLAGIYIYDDIRCHYKGIAFGNWPPNVSFFYSIYLWMAQFPKAPSYYLWLNLYIMETELRRMIMRTQKAGITCLELLIIIVVIVFLVLLLSPVLLHFCNDRSRPPQRVCTSNLRQLSMAVTMYSQDNKNHLPGL